jgi:hypothetical protein
MYQVLRPTPLSSPLSGSNPSADLVDGFAHVVAILMEIKEALGLLWNKILMKIS